MGYRHVWQWFSVEVIGGKLIHDIAGFSEVRIADIIVGMSEQPSGWTDWDTEYPDYAFYADAENFLPMIEWLKTNGVVTSGPWTRDGKKGLMYFRDPSGNLFVNYCGKDLPQSANFPRGAKQVGAYVTDYASLFYD